jgi:hypothetical protein
MNKFYKLVLLSFLFSFFLVFDTNGQGFNSRNRYWAIGGALNAMNYVGELDPGPSFLSPGIKFTRYNFGIDVLRRISPRIFIRGTFSMGRIKGNDFDNSKYTYTGGDIFRKARNLDFFSQIYELKGDVIIDLIEHRGKYMKRPDFVPFLFVGLAYFHHNPKTEMNGKTYNLHDYSTEGQGVVDGAPHKYRLNQIALPIGLGIRYKLSKQLDLSFEMGWRFTTTDYLDDVGGKYVDPSALASAKGMDAVMLANRTPEVVGDANFAGYAGTYAEVVNGSYTGRTSFLGYGADGNQRGDKKGRRDAYIITGLHLVYIIPSKVICPKFR